MPSMLTVEVVDRIIADVADGKPVRTAIGEHAKGNAFAFYRMLRAHPELGTSYDRAKLDGLEAMADETIALADEAAATPEAIAKARLQIDTRKWHLSKLAPKKYGDKLELGGRIEIPVVRIRDMTGKKDDDEE